MKNWLDSGSSRDFVRGQIVRSKNRWHDVGHADHTMPVNSLLPDDFLLY